MNRAFRELVVEALRAEVCQGFAIGIIVVDPVTFQVVATTPSLHDIEHRLETLATVPEFQQVIAGRAAWTEAQLKIDLGGVAIETRATVSWLVPFVDDWTSDRLLVVHLDAVEIAARAKAAVDASEVVPVCFSHDVKGEIVMFDDGFRELGPPPSDPYHFYMRCHPADLDAFAPLARDAFAPSDNGAADIGPGDVRRFACYAIGPSGSWEYWVGTERRTWRRGQPEKLVEARVACPAFAVREQLSASERLVLAAIALRVPTAQIAAEMFVNASTVRNHVAELSRKLSVGGRREIESAFALR